MRFITGQDIVQIERLTTTPRELKKPQAPAPKAIKAKADTTPKPPAKTAPAKGGAVKREVSPEEVIPLEDDFKDF
jgi:hypothetical protein